MFQHPHLSHCQFHFVPTYETLLLPFLSLLEARGGGGSRDGERQKKHSTACGRVDERSSGMARSTQHGSQEGQDPLALPD